MSKRHIDAIKEAGEALEDAGSQVEEAPALERVCELWS
jgi:hypothetical protein